MDPQEAVTFLLTKVRKTFDLNIDFLSHYFYKWMRIACWSRARKKDCPVIQVEFPVGQETFYFHSGKSTGELSANLIVFKDLPRGRKILELLWSKLEFKFFSSYVKVMI